MELSLVKSGLMGLSTWTIFLFIKNYLPRVRQLLHHKVVEGLSRYNLMKWQISSWFFKGDSSIVTQPMLQCWPNCTELRSMDSYIQILCRFYKYKGKVPPLLLFNNEKSPFTPPKDEKNLPLIWVIFHYWGATVEELFA